MKNIFFLLIILLVSIGHSQSALENKDLAVAYIASMELCDCMNTFLNELHPQLLTLLEESIELDQEKAEENFMNFLLSASEEDMDKISQDIELMNNAEVILNQRCEMIYEKYEHFDTPKFEQDLINALSNNEDCKLLYNILKSEK